ncbi:N-acetylneuraminate synthase family protein [Thermodesulfobacteriota bacterium]
MMDENQTLVIDGRPIGYGFPVYIIAEAGVNHNGDIKTAKAMIEEASCSGVDAVKFQTYTTRELILKDAMKAPYQELTTKRDETQYEMLERLEIDNRFHRELIECCQKNSVTFLSTPYDESSLGMLLKLKIAAIKVASTDANNLIFLEKIGRERLPVILSTGMCTLGEIDSSVKQLSESGCQKLVILQCTSEYPAPEHEVNLRCITTLSGLFGVPIGFSDHTRGIGAAPYAVAAGATVIEKHFTLDKRQEGPDHKASLNPEELKMLVQEIRRVERLLGNGQIGPSISEWKNRPYLQKCLTTRKAISFGERFSFKNLVAKRTGGRGISAALSSLVIGKKSRYDFNQGEIIFFKDLGDEE